MDPQYFRGQGPILIADRDTSGNPLEFREAGDASALTVTPSSTAVGHNEHKTGRSLEDNRFYHSQKADCEIDFDEWLADDLALCLWGTATPKVSGTVSSETINGTLTLGSTYRLANPNVSSLVLTDSAGTPATLVEGTDYTVNPVYGSFKLISDPSTFTGPLKAAYSYAASTDVGLMTAQTAEKFVRYEAVNSAAGGKPFLVELFRVKFDVTSGLALIADTYSTNKLKGAVLYDSLRVADTVLGQFGRITQIG